MEGVSKIETKDSSESVELTESIERAKELSGQLKEFDDTDVVGREALAEVDLISSNLKKVLENIPADVRLQEGLHYHPMDEKAT